MEETNQESVEMFNDGCMYYAHTTDEGDFLHKPRKYGFHTIVFYEKFSGQNVIANVRGPSFGPYIRKLVDEETSVDDMQKICLETLINILRKDNAHGWYENKLFVPGEYHNESVQDYIKRNSGSFAFKSYELSLHSFFCPIK